MTQRLAARDREGALCASRLIANAPLRAMKLREGGFWEELAAVTDVSQRPRRAAASRVGG